MKNLFPAFLLVALLAVPARADPVAEMPAALQGLWAIPNCGTGDMVQAVSSRFRLQATGYSDSLARLADLEVVNENVVRTSIRALPHEYRLSAGALEIYGSDGTKCIAPAVLPAPQAEGVFFPYERCTDVRQSWGTLKQEHLDDFLKLDDIDRACYGRDVKTYAPCHQAMLAAFDADKNDGLDEAEIKAGFRTMAYLSATQVCSFADEYPARADKGAAPFAAFAIKHFDDDKNGRIGVAEWVAHWSSLDAQDDTKTVLPLVGQIGFALPWLPHDPEAAPYFREQKAQPVLE